LRQGVRTGREEHASSARLHRCKADFSKIPANNLRDKHVTQSSHFVR
jgi:hypothetical protein